MRLSSMKVIRKAMVAQNVARATADVAPMPPTAKKRDHRRHASMPLFPVANSFLCECRGDVIRRLLAPYVMAIVFLLTINFCFPTTNANQAYAQDAQQEQVQPSCPDQSESSLAVDAEDVARVQKLSRIVPPTLRTWLPDVRTGMHRRTPVLAFKHWASERKPVVPTFLFCLFVALIGTAFFPKQITVAQELCRARFWYCLGRAILIGITVLILVVVLDRLVITESLATALIAVLEFALIAGLSVGVSLIGERVAVKSRLANLEFFKTHPRLATFTKILIGSLIIALIVQIPGLGKLPRIGIRIATLIAILGAGGLLKTKFGTRPQSTE